MVDREYLLGFLERVITTTEMCQQRDLYDEAYDARVPALATDEIGTAVEYTLMTRRAAIEAGTA